MRAEDVLCVLDKTEGNGGRNDFTRELAMTALEHLFAPRLGIAPQAVVEPELGLRRVSRAWPKIIGG